MSVLSFGQADNALPFDLIRIIVDIIIIMVTILTFLVPWPTQ